MPAKAELVRLIEEKRKTGVYLTVLGFGMGNLQDATLEQLAHHGNGHYAYIDSIDEAKKAVRRAGRRAGHGRQGREAAGRVQPAKVAAYRLIGYENRILKNEDFRNDAQGRRRHGQRPHVTALYEIVPVGREGPVADAGDLKYQNKHIDTDAAKTGEWLTVRMRYKHPDTDEAQEIAFPLGKDGLRKTGLAGLPLRRRGRRVRHAAAGVASTRARRPGLR